MDTIMRAYVSMLVLAGGCAGREADVVDPDLVPVQSSAPRHEEVPPDERIDAPDVPGLHVVRDEKPRGKTQHVTMTEDPQQASTVTAPPKREPMGSMLPGIIKGPNK
jgi:hypothetical protein